MVADENDACVVYDLVTNSPAGTSRVAQWCPAEGDLISATDTFIDARPSPPGLVAKRRLVSAERAASQPV
jgi:hypothetical protein